MKFRFEGVVRQWDTYGDRVAKKTPVTFIAANEKEALTKARAAFGATYDSFRKFWSHDLLVESVREVEPVPTPITPEGGGDL